MFQVSFKFSPNISYAFILPSYDSFITLYFWPESDLSPPSLIEFPECINKQNYIF